MSWRDDLLPASFRGVPFDIVARSELVGGRRLAEHEYPLRNTSFVEDLGLRNRHYKITGYIVDTDYFDERDALIAALEQGGSGTLSHPYLGTLTVYSGPYNVIETLDEGGMVTFEMDFVDAGANPSPLSQNDTQGCSEEESDDTDDQLDLDLDDPSWTVIGTSPLVQQAAAGLLESVAEAFTALVENSGFDPGLAALKATLVITSTATQIAWAVTGFCQSYTQMIVASWTPFDDTQSSRGPVPVADPSYGLSTLANWGAALPAVAQNGTPDAAQMQVNQTALVAFIQGSAITAYARISARTTYATQEGAEAARSTITCLIEDQALIAADAGKDATFARWKALARAVSTDLTLRGKQVPDVVTYVFSQPRPALALAQLFYQDATQAGALIARNAAPLPLFMPLDVEMLAA